MEESLQALKNKLNGVTDRDSQVMTLADHILSHLEAFGSDSSRPTRDIVNYYLELRNVHEDFIPDIPITTFKVNLSKVSKNQSSAVNCLGRGKGYFLDSTITEIEEIEEEANNQADEFLDKGEVILEKDVYKFVKEWLFEKENDRVADISNLKRNGKWGNPDLIGLKIEDIFGRPEVEITTVEVKLTDDSWEKWIFEAVAHTRFSNRSYFAFVYPENLISKLDSSGIQMYAEHFGIGVLVMVVDNPLYLSIKKREPLSLENSDVNIIEYRHAPRNETHIKFRKKFFESLDILELNKLYSFGEKLD